MTLPDLPNLLYEGDGVYSDPVEITKLARQLNNANSRGVAASLVVKASPGLLFGFTVSSVTAQFVQIFDLAALPADGVVPLLSFPVPITADVGAQWIPPRGFQNGIVICNSSTQHTKTIGTANTIFDVQFL